MSTWNTEFFNNFVMNNVTSVADDFHFIFRLCSGRRAKYAFNSYTKILNEASMYFSCLDQKYSELNCGDFGIKLKLELRSSWKRLVFFKLGNGRGQN